MSRLVRVGVVLLLCCAGWGVAAVQGERFHNLFGEDIDKSLADVLAWQSTRVSPPLPDPPLPAAVPRLDAPRPNATWVGHATVLLQLPSLTLLTDPHFSERASPVPFAGPKRAYPPGVPLSALPHVDVVVISHNHYDHLDLASVEALAAQAGGSPLFIVPLGLKEWFAGVGIHNVVELGWWQRHAVHGVDIVLTPAHHWSSRTPWDRRLTLWGGFAILGDGLKLVYTGDTGYAPDFVEIRRRLAAEDSFDLALIPVGCYEPREFMRSQHVNPEEAVRIHQDLGARRSIGVHWGTFMDLCDEPLDQAPKDLALARTSAGLADDAFVVLQRGETRVFAVLPVVTPQVPAPAAASPDDAAPAGEAVSSAAR